MERVTFELPAMYGDHHVVEVRRLLLAFAGVEDVHASSGFRMVEVRFDASKVDPEQMRARLDEAGYLGELPMAEESGVVPITQQTENGERPFFRHTAAHEQTGRVVSFAQKVPYAGRPLWPCPGVGPLTRTTTEEEVTHG